jgi:hypothetical protein
LLQIFLCKSKVLNLVTDSSFDLKNSIITDLRCSSPLHDSSRSMRLRHIILCNITIFPFLQFLPPFLAFVLIARRTYAVYIACKATKGHISFVLDYRLMHNAFIIVDSSPYHRRYIVCCGTTVNNISNARHILLFLEYE